MGTVSTTELTTAQQNVTAAQFNSLVSPLKNEFNGSIDNVNISASAAIAYSKLSLGGNLVNADIKSNAAIDFTKLATLTDGNVLVGNGSNQAASVAVSGDVTIDNLGAVTIGADKVTAPMLAGVVTTPTNGTVSTSTNDAITSTSFTGIDSMSITITPSHADNPILILFTCEANIVSTGDKFFTIINDDVGGDIAVTEREQECGISSGTQSYNFATHHYLTLSAVEHVLTVKGKVDDGTTNVTHREFTVIEFKQN